MSYCDFVRALPSERIDPNKHYHDHVYGWPVKEDHALFERLVLEINQAGLNWTLILKKQAAFRAAYAGFDVAAVAAFDEADRARLLADTGIIRNKLKVAAAIHNAQQIGQWQAQYGSFAAWLDQHHPRTLPEWVRLFRQSFQFVGGEIVHEFLMSTGYLPGAHQPDCPVYQRVLAANPPWLQAGLGGV